MVLNDLNFFPNTKNFRVRQIETTLRRNLVLLSMLGIFIVYLVMGSAAFLFFEHSYHEKSLTRFQFNVMFNRQQFSRQISSLIFNDTKNMLIIMDRSHSKRIHDSLIKSLKEYEQKFVNLHSVAGDSTYPPSTNLNLPHEWNILNSFIYALSLLTTLGNDANLAPRTFSGQLFALLYCMLGVPFYVLTMITLAYRFFGFVGFHFNLSKFHHLIWVFVVVSIYIIWIMIFALILYSNFIPQSIWRSVFTAAFSSLTIQTHEFNAFNASGKLITLIATSISLLLSCITIFFLIGFYRGKFQMITRKRSKREIEDRKIHPENISHQNQAEKCSFDGINDSMNFNSSEIPPLPPPRFQIIVDESGETVLKLTKAAPNKSL